MRLTCAECGTRPVVSATASKCEVCLYREQLGREAAERQVAAADAERAARKAREAKRKATR